jgi:hypothetical protein
VRGPYTPGDSAFTITWPPGVTTIQVTPRTITGAFGSTRALQYAAEREPYVFGVSTMDLGTKADMPFDEAVARFDASLARMGGTVLSRTNFRVNGHPALKARVRVAWGPGLAHMRTLGIVAYGRFFHVSVIAPDERALDSGEVNSFFDSFTYRPASPRAGILDAPEVQRVVSEHLSGVQACYERELMKDRTLQGKLVFDWDVTPAGTVRNARLAGSSMEGPGAERVAACIVAELSGWTFAPPKGGTASVRYPFILRMSGL